MIQVQVPKLRDEDVERVRREMEAVTAAMRTMAPLLATMLLQVGQQMAVFARTLGQQVEYERKKRERAE